MMVLVVLSIKHPHSGCTPGKALSIFNRDTRLRGYDKRSRVWSRERDFASLN